MIQVAVQNMVLYLLAWQVIKIQEESIQIPLRQPVWYFIFENQ